MAEDRTDVRNLVDGRGRPYFLWDTEMTIDEFRRALADPDPRIGGYLHGKLMRQAKPDHVFLFTTRARIRELWPHVERHLGRTRGFWHWILRKWDEDERAAQ